MIADWAWALLNLYLFVSLCAILFDLGVIVTNDAQQRGQDRRRASLRRLLEEQLTLARAGLPPDVAGQRRLLRRLRKVDNMLAFSELAGEYAGREDFSLYLARSGPLFAKLCRRYGRRRKMYRASFAWALAACGQNIPQARDFLLACAVEKRSIYCRENALTALYRSGDAQGVVDALIRMSRNDIYHSQKLLADGFFSFRGNQAGLCALLWECFSLLAPGIRLAVVDFMRLLEADYRQALLPLLDDPSTDDELCFAILRYYGRCTWEPARERMTAFLSAPRNGLWEYAAVSASVLRSYRTEETAEALLAALSSHSWYVRYNAAESLASMDLPEAVYLRALEGEDRYARDILGYMLDHRRLASARRTEAQGEGGELLAALS